MCGVTAKGNIEKDIYRHMQQLVENVRDTKDSDK